MTIIGKSKTPSFVVERRIITNKTDDNFFNKKFDICTKLYNTSVRHYKEVLSKLYQDEWYKHSMSMVKQAKSDLVEQKFWYNEIQVCMDNYKLNEYDIHAYIGYQKKHSFPKTMGANIAQKIGTKLYVAIKKAVFSQTKLHFKKHDEIISFEDKASTTGIIYYKELDSIKIMGAKFKLKTIRHTDTYFQEAMDNKVKYCRIVRKPFKNKYKYFLQLVMEGIPPQKRTLGASGYCGLDEGVSTISYVNNHELDFVALGDGVELYEKAIYLANQKYQRRMLLNNKDCFREDGTIIKGSKFKKTKGAKRALMELKNAFRKKSTFIKQSHNILANKILEHCSTLIKEPMNFKALQKKSKHLKRQDNPSTIKQQDGTNKIIYKYKKKKRFGKSINKRSPGLFNTIIEQKLTRLGGTILEVNLQKYKASQYNHITKEPNRPSLSDRTKTIGTHLVQRDLYSAFLLYNYKNNEEIDFKQCEQTFQLFLEKQINVIERIKILGDTTKNFGIKDFIYQS